MKQSRFVVLALILGLLAGCGRAFGGFEPQTQSVTTKEIVLPVQYLEGLQAGPLYQVTITLPDDWVGKFATSNNGNIVSFNFNEKADRAQRAPAPIFSISALSERQYWKQIGGYPGSYKSILSTGDTYFIYYLPIDPYYSGLAPEAYSALAQQVPGVITSFQAKLSQ
jgi:hypothetical protein